MSNNDRWGIKSSISVIVVAAIPNRKWSQDRKWPLKWTANDPRPQVIPKVDRKWSREKLREWIGSYGTDYKKGLIIKRNLFLLPSREKGMEDGRSQVNLYKAKKKMEWNLKMILFQEFFIGVKKKILNFVLNLCNA